MSEINGISVVRNNYNINSGKTNLDNSSDFSSFLGESKSMDEIFDQAAKKYNVPVELLKAIGKAESDFNPNAVSRCGAQGVMQLMPATAKSLGVTDSFDPEQNIMGGSKYIADLLKKYDGDTRLALAAYNAGSGNVKKYGGIPPFKETQNYVKKVMKFIGEGDIQITSNGTTSVKNKTSVTNQVAASTPATPVRNNYAYLIADQAGTDQVIQDLELLFSYEDYLRFIDLLIKEEETKEAEEKQSLLTSKEINYNLPVMNLIKDTKFL